MITLKLANTEALGRNGFLRAKSMDMFVSKRDKRVIVSVLGSAHNSRHHYLLDMCLEDAEAVVDALYKLIKDEKERMSYRESPKKATP